MAFDLTVESLRNVWVAQRGRCALTGLQFHDERHVEAQVKEPFAPSLDRIDSSRGYVEGNVQIVCSAANFAKGQWGLDVLRRVARGVVAAERTQERAWYASRRSQLKKAEAALAGLTGAEGERQKRVVAGIRASMTKGPAGEAGAGRRASQARKKRGT